MSAFHLFLTILAVLSLPRYSISQAVETTLSIPSAVTTTLTEPVTIPSSTSIVTSISTGSVTTPSTISTSATTSSTRPPTTTSPTPKPSSPKPPPTSSTTTRPPTTTSSSTPPTLTTSFWHIVRPECNKEYVCIENRNHICQLVRPCRIKGINCNARNPAMKYRKTNAKNCNHHKPDEKRVCSTICDSHINAKCNKLPKNPVCGCNYYMQKCIFFRNPCAFYEYNCRHHNTPNFFFYRLDYCHGMGIGGPAEHVAVDH